MPGKKKTEPRAKAQAEKPKKTTKAPAKAPKAKAPKVKTPKAVKEKAPKAPRAVKPVTLSRARKALSAALPIPSGRFPRKGETRMIAFIRDPQCLFTYWEVTPESVDAVKSQLMEEYKGSSMVLRVFRTGPGGQVDLIREIRIEPGEMNRYIELPAEGGVFFLEVVQKAKSGKVAVLTRSNTLAVGPGAAWAFPAPGSEPGFEPPAGLRDYFADEWGPEGAVVPGRGLSSAETQVRSRGKYAASHVG